MVQNQQHAWDILLHMFPTSVIDSMARGDILQVVIFSMFFGIALAAIGAKGQPVLDVLESTAQAMFKFTGYVMAFAPVGVFAAIAATVGSKGLGILLTLGKLVGLMYLGLAIFALIVLGSVSYLIRVPFLTFVKAIREPMLIAFTTASSEAALPKSLEIMERFGVPKSIVGFVLPTGYSFNLDGSTLYLSLCSVFVAQMAGVADDHRPAAGDDADADADEQRGRRRAPRRAGRARRDARAPSACRSKAPRSCSAIDQIMDMGRTAVNVMGNCIATAVVARWEGVFDDARMRAFADGIESKAA